MFLSLSMTTYNRKKLTEVCIDSIVKTTPRNEHELIVVDNNSTDGTIEMLEDMKRCGVIDKLILNPENYHIGKSKNQAWDIADENAEWLLMTNNDFFFMDGWFENLRTVVTDLEKEIDYVNCIYLEGTIRNKVAPGIPKKTKNGGCYLEPVLRKKKKVDVGGSQSIKQSTIKKYNIRLSEKPFIEGYTGPAPVFYKLLYKIGLKGVRLDKPCMLLQDPEYNNPEYYEYYNETFGIRGIEKLLRFYRKHGSLRDPLKYYEGTNYLQKIKQYNDQKKEKQQDENN